MKKSIAFIALLLIAALVFVSCGKAIGIAGARVDENGNLILTLTDGTEQNAGKVKGEDGAKGEPGESAADENPQGLDFYLLPDGTYGVKAGKALYLEEIVIPETYHGKKVTQILSYAFDGCSNLVSIEIPTSVTSIGTRAFNNCSNLTSATILAGVTSISEHAFYHCSSLASIKIPAGVTNIGSYAFDGCSSLASIEIPTSVTFIGGSAFWGCSSLTAVYYGGGSSDWANVLINGGSNSYIMNAPRYYYSEAKPEANFGSYWHYVDGVPTVWTEND